MNCKKCGRKAEKYGSQNYKQSYYCTRCKYHFSAQTKVRKTAEERKNAVRLLLNGNSMAAVAKEVGVTKKTIHRWIAKSLTNDNKNI